MRSTRYDLLVAWISKINTLTPDSERGREERGREEANGDATSSKGHDEQVDNGQDDGEQDEETRDDGRRDEEDGGEGRDSAAVDGGDNDGEGEGTKTRTEDEDINWDDAGNEQLKPYAVHKALERGGISTSTRTSGGRRGSEAPCAAQQCGNGAPALLVSTSTDFPNEYG